MPKNDYFLILIVKNVHDYLKNFNMLPKSTLKTGEIFLPICTLRDKYFKTSY